MRAEVRTACSIFLSVILLTACQATDHARSDHGTADSESAPRPVDAGGSDAFRTVAGAPVPVLPLGQYQMTPPEEREVERGVEILADKCMRKIGLTWPVEPPSPGVAHSPDERRYGIVDPVTAAVYGYQLPPAVGATQAQERAGEKQEERRENSISAAARKAYTGEVSPTRPGSGNGGCRGEAREALGLPARNDQSRGRAVWAAQTEAWSRTTTDGRAEKADADWRACMKKSGHSYATPHVAAADPRWWKAGGPGTSSGARIVSKEQIAVAVADVACKRQVHYTKTWQSVEAEYQRQSIQKRLQALESEQAEMRVLLARVRGLTAQPVL